MDKRGIVNSLTEVAYKELVGRGPGGYVDLHGHDGQRATQADIAAHQAMKREAQRLRAKAIFVSEETDDPDAIPYPDPSRDAEVFLADPCDGSRQHAQLSGCFASCVSMHTYTPHGWWRLEAASITAGEQTSWGPDHSLLGPGGNTDDSVDLREHTTRSRVRTAPCIAVGPNSPSSLFLVSELGHVRDPEVSLGTPGEDAYLPVWNTAGNPITSGLLRSGTMVAVQLKWSTQWDTMFAFLASTVNLCVYPLVGNARGEPWPVDENGKPQPLNEWERRLWWGRPRWHTFERKCIPPIVVGPPEPYTHKVYEIVRASDCVQRQRPCRDEVDQVRFEEAMRQDLEDYAKERERRTLEMS